MQQAAGPLVDSPRFAPSPVVRVFALISKSFDQTTAQLIERAFGIIRIITVPLAGDQHVKSVVDVVIPLGGVCF